MCNMYVMELSNKFPALEIMESINQKLSLMFQFSNIVRVAKFVL
jgi:hypothetical protein